VAATVTGGKKVLRKVTKPATEEPVKEEEDGEKGKEETVSDSAGLAAKPKGQGEEEEGKAAGGAKAAGAEEGEGQEAPAKGRLRGQN